MVMPQTQAFTRGQIVDRERSMLRSRCYAGRLYKWTVTIASAETGTFSFKLVGPGGPFTIAYAATVGPDTNATIAAGLRTKIMQTPGAFKLVYPSVSGAVLTLEARMPAVPFELTDAVDPGSATLTPEDLTPGTDELQLGTAVALVTSDPNSIRTLVNGDVAGSIFGIVLEEPGEMKLSEGVYDQDDVYEKGSMPTIGMSGQFPVQVETDIVITDLVYTRKLATGSEVPGAFRASADGTDTLLLSNCKWLGDSYYDLQGRKTAMLLVNLP
jgi:hypothetical protein